jgi:hypothetical protein
MKINKLLAKLAIGAVLLAGTQVALAQATRTWVSGVGDDANPCSRTAPCKTFAGAISKTAAGGEINVLDPGGFGAVNINKSLTIDGAGTQASILASGTNGIIVNAGANDVVTLRNLSINGGTPTAPGLIGIKILAAKTVNIENVVINNFLSASPNGRGISDQRVTATNQLQVLNTSIFNSGRSGIVIGVTNANLDRVHISGSGGAGLVANAGARVNVRNSSSTSNDVGYFVDGSSSRLMVVDSSASSNNAGISAVNGGMAMISGVTITRNGTGIVNATGTVLSYQNNQIDGNTTDGNPSSVLTLR